MVRICISGVVAGAFLAGAAGAATIMTDGGSYDLATDNEFNYTNYTASADAADDRFTFQMVGGGLIAGATAFSIFLDAVNSDIDELSAIWSTAANGGGDVINSTAFNPAGLPYGFIELETTFDVYTTQWLTIEWEGTDDDALISVEVQPVPVPASALLLAGGLAGFSALRRSGRR